jgi:hypothetical protein
MKCLALKYSLVLEKIFAEVMKTIAVLLLTLCSYIAANGQPIYVKIRPLEGYFIDNKIPLKEGLNYFVFRDQRKFEKFFGKIDKPDAPDFEMERVIAIVCSPTKKQTELGLYPKVAKAGDYMEVYFTFNQEKHDLTYISSPIVVAAIPIHYATKKFRFYDEPTRKLMEEVPIR